MRTYSFLLTVGILVFITPFLGIPESWKAVFLFTLGTCIVVIALTHRFTNRRDESVRRDDFYTESEPATHPVGEM
jgi:membrane protein implicated in regulation of membrane protease activity